MSPRTLGILLRILSGVFFVLMSAFVHEAVKYATIGQTMFWRSLLSMPFIVAYAATQGPLRKELHMNSPRSHLIRGSFSVTAMVCSFASLKFLPVAYASAVGFLAPIFVLPLSVIFLGERLRAVVVVACGVGFLGMLILVFSKTSDGTLGDGALIGFLFALGFALAVAISRVQVKTMSDRETTSMIALSFTFITTTAGLVTLPWGWNALTPYAYMILAMTALFGALGHITVNEAIKRSEISTLAPFEYLSIIWALGIDILIFGQTITLISLIGIALIISAGLSVAFKRPSKTQVEAPR